MPPLSRLTRLAVCGAWATFTLATTSWISWQAGIDAQYSSDVVGYERVARAAPGLPPAGALIPQHAQHFVPHYLAGTLADVTGLPLHLVYRVLALAVLALIALTVDRLLADASVGAGSYIVCMGALLTSPYVFRFSALAPGMLQDATFALGAAVALLGLVRRRTGLAALGVALAVAGRGDSAGAVGVAALGWIVLVGAWRPRRLRAASLVLATFAASELVTYGVSRRFAGGGDVHGFESFTLVGTLAALPGSVGTLGSHLARIFVGLTVPLALVCGCLLLAASLRRRFHTVTVASLAYSAAIVAQVVAMNPGWLQGSQPRLSSLGLAPLVAATGFLLGDLEQSRDWAWSPRTVAFSCVVIGVASLHLHYSVLRPATTPSRFLALELVSALLIAAPFVQRARRSRRPAQDTSPTSGSLASPPDTALSARSTSSG